MSENPRSTDQSSSDAGALSAAEASFAQRVGAALRRAEAVPPDLERHVMRAVASEAPDGFSGRGVTVARWWTRPRHLTLSPLGGLALAAGFAGLVALGAWGVAGQLGAVGWSASRGASVASARTDTVHLVRFVFVEPTASRVALAGDFNGWSTEARPLAMSGDNGVWSVTVPLAAGRYEYAFVVDGERWVADPFARRVSDEFGGESSVIRLDGSEIRTM